MRTGLFLILFVAAQFSYAEGNDTNVKPNQPTNHKEIKAAINPKMKVLIDEAIETKIREETKLFAEKMEEKIQKEALATQSSATNDVSKINLLVTWLLGFMAFGISVVLFVSAGVIWRGLLSHQLLNREADIHIQESKNRVDTEMQKLTTTFENYINEQKRGITQIIDDFEKKKEGLERAWGDIDKDFKDLPEPLHEPKAKRDEISLPLEMQVVWKDYDSILVMCDRLKLSSNEYRISDDLTKVAAFWRLMGNFYQASERNKRAIKLHGKSSHSYEGLVTTLIYWIGADRASPKTQDRISEGFATVNTALKLGYTSVVLLHHRGWLYDDIGDLGNAIKDYREAKARDQLETGGKKVFIGYNLACALSKSGQFDDALSTIKEVCEKEPKWAPDAKDDNDFISLKNSPNHGKIFDDLIEQAIRKI